MRLLVTGCGRSGTKFITHLLKQLGLSVGHERIGEDGMVSWLRAVKPDAETVVHLVRHPLGCIASASGFADHIWHFVAQFVPSVRGLDAIGRATEYWIEWNRMLRELRPDARIVRVEDMEGLLASVRPLGVPVTESAVTSLCEELRNDPGAVHDWLPERGCPSTVTWGQIPRVHEVRAMARGFGYEDSP